MGLFSRKDSKNWWASYSVNGRQVVVSTKTSDRSQAEQFWDELRRQLPAKPVGVRAACPTVEGKSGIRGVYAIKSDATGLIKIGRSENVEARVRHLNFSSPEEWKLVAIRPCRYPVDMETLLHGWFKEKRIRGEWFRITEAEVLQAFSIEWKPVLHNVVQDERPYDANGLYGADGKQAKGAIND